MRTPPPWYVTLSFGYMSCADACTQEYVTWLLQVCRECLIHLLDDELPDSASPDAVHEVHEIFKSFPMFFKVVWDIRRPLLTSNYCRTTPILPGFNTVYLSLIDVGQLTNQLISKITPYAATSLHSNWGSNPFAQ